MNRSAGILRCAARYIDKKTRVTLFNTLVLPHIDYCSTVWGNCISKTDIAKLQRIQNCAMRIILECHYRTHISDRLQTLQWLSIEQRLYFNLCCLVWKTLNSQTPKYMEHYFQATRTVHTHGTRSSSSNMLHMGNSHGKSLKLNGTQAWNKLPEMLRDTKNFKAFKVQLLTFIKTNMPYE